MNATLDRLAEPRVLWNQGTAYRTHPKTGERVKRLRGFSRRRRLAMMKQLGITKQ